MRPLLLVTLGMCVGLVAAAPVVGWSLADEVTAIDPDLAVEVVWELHDAKIYCESLPANLDRLACEFAPDPGETWIGLDAAGNRYGVIVTDEPTGSYFDIYRRPVGTSFNNHVVRITKRVEQVFGEPVKLRITGRWEIDLTNGWLLLQFRGECLTAACQGENDIDEHLALVRITGLPGLVELFQTYQLPGELTFRVPRLPEGLPSGDRFDVYSGDVATLADLSQAQPLACDVAAGRSAGSRVVVGDPLTDPFPGQARYYLTAVTSGMDRRAGRMRPSGVLHGRNAAALPPCALPSAARETMASSHSVALPSRVSSAVGRGEGGR